MPTFPKVLSPGRRETTGARLSNIQAIYRSKGRAAWLAAGATAVMAVALALWVIPWVPIGMTQDDLSPKVSVALMLASGSALTGLLAFFTREPASTEGQVAEVWRGILGKGVRLRNQRQFRYALARACESAQRDGRLSLSLLLVRVSPGQDDDGSGPVSRDALEHIVYALALTVRSSDVIGTAGDDEIGVLAIGVGAEARDMICARFERALTAALVEWRGAKVSRKAPVVSLGASTYGADDDLDALVAAARQALRPISLEVARAA